MKHYYPRSCLFSLALILGLFSCMTHFSPAHAASFTVTATRDSGPGSLRQALIDSNLTPGPDVISFAVTGTIVIDSPLPTVQDNVTLQGPGAELATISGSYLHRIFDVSAGVAMTISDVALTQGRAPNGEGGGAVRSYGSLTLERVNLHDNLSVEAGGAVYVENGALQIASSLIQSNTADTNGGIYIGKSTATISGTELAENRGSAIMAERSPALYVTATRVVSSTGRGLDLNSSRVYLSGAEVSSNGGGIYARSTLLTIAGSKLVGNQSEEGAGVYATWSRVALTDTLLERNVAGWRGGAFYLSLWDDNFTMAGGSITGNLAPSGAGIYLAGGNLQVQDSQILDNVGENGPALYLSSMRDAVVKGSCITNNYVTSRKGTAVQFESWNSYYLAAPDNWWGAADGPSGAGPGSGDSVAERVIYTNFKTTAPEGCPTLWSERAYLPAVNR